METTSQQLLKRATQEGKMPLPYLKLAEQITDENGKKKGVRGTGKHTVKFLSDKAITGKDYTTKQERPEIEYTFEEDGQKKRYSVPVHNKNGELHYFVQRMAEVEIGEVITLKYQKKPNSFEGFIDFQRTMEETQSEPEIPTEEKEISVIEDEEIDVKNIPL